MQSFNQEFIDGFEAASMASQGFVAQGTQVSNNETIQALAKENNTIKNVNNLSISRLIAAAAQEQHPISANDVTRNIADILANCGTISRAVLQTVSICKTLTQNITGDEMAAPRAAEKAPEKKPAGGHVFKLAKRQPTQANQFQK